MADFLSRETRSRVMARIRSKNTKPEIALLRASRPGVTLLIIFAAAVAGWSSPRVSASVTSGRICKVSFAPKSDSAVDFISYSGSCSKFLAFVGPGVHLLPRTAVFGEPRCAFKTSSTSKVGAGVIVFKTRSPKSVFGREWCRYGIDPGRQYWTKGWRRVSISYAAAAAANANR